MRIDVGLDRLLAPDTQLQAIQEGFDFTEGATWLPQGKAARSTSQTLSPIRSSRIHRICGTVQVFEERAGFSDDFNGVNLHTVGSVRDNGFDPKDPGFKTYAMIGADGLGADRDGRLIACTFAGRSIVRYNFDGSNTVLADKWHGKRFDGPNDVAVRKGNTVYFTDMVLGMREQDKDPSRQMDTIGIYRIKNGEVTRILSGFAWANGLAFSPDEKWLYANNTRVRNDISRYRVLSDGTVNPDEEQIVDMNKLATAEHLGEGKGLTDGLRVDAEGNIWCAGPGGL